MTLESEWYSLGETYSEIDETLAFRGLGSTISRGFEESAQESHDDP